MKLKNLSRLLFFVLMIITGNLLGMEKDEDQNFTPSNSTQDNKSIFIIRLGGGNSGWPEETIEVPNRVVQLCGTLQNLLNNMKDIEEEKEEELQEESPPIIIENIAPEIPLNPANVDPDTIKNFFSFLETIVQQVEQSISNLAASNDSIDGANRNKKIVNSIKNIINKNKNLNLKMICGYAIMASYLSVPPVVLKALGQALIELISNPKQKPSDQRSLIQNILNYVEAHEEILAIFFGALSAAVNKALKKMLGFSILKGHTEWVTTVAFSNQGSLLASGGYDKKIIVWNLRSKIKTQQLEGPTGWTASVAFDPSGRTLAAGGFDKKVSIWNVDSRAIIQQLEGSLGWITSVAFSPGGHTIAAGSIDTEIYLWNVKLGRMIQNFKGHTKGVTSIAISPDAFRIASGSNDTTVRIWNIDTGAEIRQLNGHTQGITSVAFSPDGRTIASGSNDKTVRIWDIHSGAEIRQLNGHTQGVTSVAFSPDGSTIASGSNDKTVRIWDIYTGEEIRQLKGHTQGVTSVAFSPDGRTIASGSNDKTVRIWSLLRQSLPSSFSGIINDLTIEQSAAILTYANARENNQHFDWEASPEILQEMHQLPLELQSLLNLRTEEEVENKEEKEES